jgi:hypothetical protein
MRGDPHFMLCLFCPLLADPGRRGESWAMERSDVIRPAYRTASVPVQRDYATIAADPLIVLHAAAPFNLQGLEFLFSEVHLATTTRKIPSFFPILFESTLPVERTDEMDLAATTRDILFRLKA